MPDFKWELTPTTILIALQLMAIIVVPVSTYFSLRADVSASQAAIVELKVTIQAQDKSLATVAERLAKLEGTLAAIFPDRRR